MRLLERAAQTRPFKKKSQLQRLLETVSDSLDVPSGIKFSLPDAGSAKAVRTGLIAVGGLAGLTAGSAGISSLRRRREGARDDS
jgi:hypothetical protein